MAVAFANQTAAVSTTAAWQQWNLQYVISSTSTTAIQLYATQPWEYWNSTYANGTIAYATGGTFSYTYEVPWERWNTQYAETAEAQAARVAERERQRAENERLYAADRARQAVVNSRAEQLLMSLLNDEQRRTRREHGWFEVRGSAGGRWRIRNRGQSGNVDLMPQDGDVSRSDPDRDIRLMSFCIHPPDRLPDADAHVAQMLGIVTDELAFRRTGNVTHQRADLPRNVDRATVGLSPAEPVPEPVPLLLRGPSTERARRRRNEHRRLAAA